MTDTCVDRCDTACTARVTPHKLGRGTGIDAQRSRIDEGKRVPVRVERPHHGGGRRGNRARRRHHNRWAKDGSGFLIKMISDKDEIRKQVLGEDPDLEKSGRKLNRVIEWDRDGITIEEDQRHVREIMKGLELERANHSATPCAVEREMKARERTDADEDRPSADDNRGLGWPTTVPFTVRHSQVVTSHDIEHSLHE